MTKRTQKRSKDRLKETRIGWSKKSRKGKGMKEGSKNGVKEREQVRMEEENKATYDRKDTDV